MDETCDAYSFQHPYSKIKKISFHLFPKDRETKQKWIDAIRTYRKGYLPMKTSVLCSEHFIDSDFTPRGMRLVLRPSSIPTVFDDTLMRKQKALIQQYELDTNKKKFDQFARKNFSYKNYKANRTRPQLTAPQINLKLKPELFTLLQKRNKPILLRRKPKETGNKKQIPECIWVMPSGSVSTTSPYLSQSNSSTGNGIQSKKIIQLIIPKGSQSSTDINRNYSQFKNIFGPNTSQSFLGSDEFVKEEQEIHNDHVLEIKELIKQEHEYCIKSERTETNIKQEFPKIEQEFQFVDMKEEYGFVIPKGLQVKKKSELLGKRPDESELIVPELTAEIKMEQADESNEKLEAYFEFVDVDMTVEDEADYQEDTLRNTQTEEHILS